MPTIKLINIWIIDFFREKKSIFSLIHPFVTVQHFVTQLCGNIMKCINNVIIIIIIILIRAAHAVIDNMNSSGCSDEKRLIEADVRWWCHCGAHSFTTNMWNMKKQKNISNIVRGRFSSLAVRADSASSVSRWVNVCLQLVLSPRCRGIPYQGKPLTLCFMCRSFHVWSSGRGKGV